MSEVRRRRFDKEFKLEAVRLVVEEGNSYIVLFNVYETFQIDQC